MKRIAFLLPDIPGRILVAGTSPSSYALYLRILSQTKGVSGWEVTYADAPVGRHNYLFLVGAPPHEVPTGFGSVYYFSDFLAEGYSDSQEQLSNSDWQATRDIERQLLAMHEAGIWQLPDDVRQRMLDREQMRVDVDREIAESG